MTDPTSSTPRRAARDETPPPTCPACEHPLTDHPYYQVVPSPTVRTLRSLAWALIPVLALVDLILIATWDRVFIELRYYFVAVVFLPSLLIYGLSRYLPTDRRVICLRCSWFRDYPSARAELV